MKKYENIELEVIDVSSCDIVTVSRVDDDDEWFPGVPNSLSIDSSTVSW